jgi:hypothetical protein
MASASIPLRERVTALLGDALIMKLAGGSFWSLAIKVSSAGLTYLMLVLIARSMNAAEFGRF